MRRLTRFQCGSLLVASVASSAPAVGHSQQRPELKDFLSAPFASELVASRSGGKVAWMQNVLGARNIWVAEPPEYRGRQVTRYTKDEGKYLVQLAFTPDGSSIVYTWGGAHSGTRLPDPPNPSLDPAGGKEEVWIVSTAGGQPTRIDDGLWASVSPRGDWVAYLKRDEIWGAPLTKSARGTVAGTPRRLIKDRGTAAPQGNAASLLWSPTENRLAFISLRDQHNFIGVLDVGANSIVFLDPSTDRDQWPTWSPDGTRIAFVRIPSTPAPPATPGVPSTGGGRGRGLPWSIRVADVKSGKGREVFRAAEGDGSAFWLGFMNNDRQLLWAADDRVIFPWERTGWMHMYSVAVSGGQPTDLTPGDNFEVEHVALAPNGRELIFSSNQGDIDRRHLWRVSSTGGPPRPVTTGTGIEYWPVFTSDGATLAFQSTTSRNPPQVEILRMRDVAAGPVQASARQVLAPGVAPTQFPAASLVELQPVIFKSTDGVEVHGQLFLPPNYRQGERYPALVYLHGGPTAQMVLGYHYHRYDYYHKPYALNQYLANQGYIILSVNYRRGTGYGLKFREAENPVGGTPRDGRDVIDIVGAGLYLRTRPDVDAGRIGIWGGSAGGQRTVLGMAFAPEIYAAGFDLHGSATQLTPAQLDAWKAPVLVVHGDDDRNVPFPASVTLVSELRRRGVEVELLVLPNEIHSFLRHESWLRAFETAADFFDRRLKNRTVGAQ